MDFTEMIKQLYAVEELQGYSKSEIAAVKEQFNALPQVLEDFWRTAGRTVEIHQVQDTWISPEDCLKERWLGDGEYLILLNENQGVCRVGIHREDMGKADPPVYLNTVSENWELCTETLSEFLQAMLAYEAVFTFSCGPEDFVLWLTKEEQGLVESQLEKLPYAFHGWMDIDMHFYSNAPDNMVVLMGDGEEEEVQVIYGAANEASYEKLMEVMDGLGDA